MLTDRQIKLEKPDPSKNKLVSDADGLYLKVTKNGHKSFVFRYTYGPDRKEMTLGSYPEVSLVEAREKRREAARMVSELQDPLSRKLEAHQELRDAISVEALAQQFFQEWLAKPNLSGYEQPQDAYTLLKRDPVRVLGKMLARDVRHEHLMAVFNDMGKRGVRVQPKRTLAVTKKMFGWATLQRIIPSDPSKEIMPKDVGGKEKPGNRNLLLEQIAEVFDVLNSAATGMHVQTRLAIKLLLSTTKRAGELVTLRWCHMDLEAGEWLNPSELTKEKHGDHKVFLSRYSLRVLKQLEALNPDSEWVLPRIRAAGGRVPKREPLPHIDTRTLSNAVLELFKDGTLTKKWTPHDLRRTFSSRVADLGVGPHIAEKCLDHLMTGVMAVYNHASYFPERREAMELWGMTLEELDPLPNLARGLTYMNGRALRGSGEFEGKRAEAKRLREQSLTWNQIAKQCGFPSGAAARMACNRESVSS